LSDRSASAAFPSSISKSWTQLKSIWVQRKRVSNSSIEETEYFFISDWMLFQQRIHSLQAPVESFAIIRAYPLCIDSSIASMNGMCGNHFSQSAVMHAKNQTSFSSSGGGSRTSVRHTSREEGCARHNSSSDSLVIATPSESSFAWSCSGESRLASKKRFSVLGSLPISREALFKTIRLNPMAVT
jgi:hypothetical protein